MILSAINKKQTFGELINQANAMVTSVLHDPLKRSFNIIPSKCNFGPLIAGKTYEIVLTLQNEDSMAQRITVKATQDKRISVQHEELAPGITKTGPIAPGMTKKLYVIIKSDPEDTGVIKEEIQILTKADIFKIPVEAHIMSKEQFDEVNKES